MELGPFSVRGKEVDDDSWCIENFLAIPVKRLNGRFTGIVQYWLGLQIICHTVDSDAGLSVYPALQIEKWIRGLTRDQQWLD